MMDFQRKLEEWTGFGLSKALNFVPYQVMGY